MSQKYSLGARNNHSKSQTLKSDNVGATLLASSQVCHTKLKHVAMIYGMYKRVEDGTIIAQHILGSDQKDDVLMMALRSKLFLDHRVNLVEILPQT